MTGSASEIPNRPEVIAFLNAIRDEPDDETPRLILADWLEERDDPRGTFLRCETELASTERFTPRYWELRRQRNRLWKQHQIAWTTALESYLDKSKKTKITTRQGLLGLPFDAEQIEHPSFLDLTGREEWAWVDELRIENIQPRLRAVMNHPMMAHLSTLNLNSAHLHVDGAVELAKSPVLSHLHRLELKSNQLQDQGLSHLLRSEKLNNLAELELSNNSIGEEGILCLADCEFPLQELNLAFNGLLTEKGARRLAQASWLSSIRSLNLTLTGARSQDVSLLLRAPSLSGLQHLDFAFCRASTRRMEEMTQSAFVDTLMSLDLTHNRLNAEMLRILGSVKWKSLRTLNLSRNSITSEVIEALISSPGLSSRLDSLIVTGTTPDSLALEVMSECPFFSQLRSLRIRVDDPRRAGFESLFRSPHFANLEVLELENRSHPHDWLIGLLCDSALGNLRRLQTHSGWGIGVDEIDTRLLRLLESRTLSRLQEMGVRSLDSLSPATQEALEGRIDLLQWTEIADR